jgi:purine-cytosine permease-like protein
MKLWQMFAFWIAALVVVMIVLGIDVGHRIPENAVVAALVAAALAFFLLMKRKRNLP